MYEIEVEAPFIGAKEIKSAYELLGIAPDNLWLTIPHISRMEQAWNYMYWEATAALEDNHFVERIVDIALDRNKNRWFGTAIMKSIYE